MTADYDYLPVKSKLETYGGCSGQLVVRGRVFVRRNGTLRVLVLGLLAGVDLVLVVSTLRRTERRPILRCYIYWDTAVLDTDTRVLLLRRRTNRLVHWRRSCGYETT